LKILAEMAELADALDSGSSPRKGVEVRVLFSAFSNQQVVGVEGVLNVEEEV
jgi:hypothetical protein